MKQGKWVIGMIVGIAMLQAGTALANDSDSKVVVDAKTKSDFSVTAAAIRQQVGPGGRWQYTSKLEKDQINQRLEEMQSLFDKFGSIDQMDVNSKQQLFNDQEAVNEILTKRDDNRIVCQNETPTGSHLSKRICRTYGQIKADEENSRKYMYDRLATPQLRGGG